MKTSARASKTLVCLLIFLTTHSQFVLSQTGTGPDTYSERPSRLRGVIEKYDADAGILNRFYSAPLSTNRVDRFTELNMEWLKSLKSFDFASLNHDEQIDYVLFRNFLEHEQKELARNAAQIEEMSQLVPFAKTISNLEDERRKLVYPSAQTSAALLNDLKKVVVGTQRLVESGAIAKPKRTVANRAAKAIGSLRTTLQRWYGFHSGYDPEFTWWNAEPYKALDTSLQSYQTFVSEKLVGIRPDDNVTIIGDPIGREALMEELAYEMIPYTPEELIELANKEFAWCESEMKKASREMGFGDDWKKALESVKQKYVEPGKQPQLIKDLAYQAIEFVEKNSLVTVPPVARDGWRMEMMSPERQLQSPFFLGGETILVSYPTNTMTHEQKMMSMRGNNPHFSHATVHHELIPGHHLQGFMNQRYRPYRRSFSTPFWTEGWALYWEFLLWDKGFNATPEDRVGALFWRMHRCARIIFSLSFHLEKMTPQESVDFLVDRVGHERDNASAEVRRSFAGDYGPLYQVAYMLGGLQFYSLHREFVDPKKMSDRDFHDTILKEGPIPVEMVRAILSKQ
ncbi:MAG: DUF885 family protein, partial [Acidobacteriota bacterium]